jgi:hypothetical protein
LHVLEHGDVDFNVQAVVQAAVLHAWAVLAAAPAHRVVSVVAAPLPTATPASVATRHSTERVCSPPPHTAEHAPNSPMVHAYVRSATQVGAAPVKALTVMSAS